MFLDAEQVEFMRMTSIEIKKKGMYPHKLALSSKSSSNVASEPPEPPIPSVAPYKYNH